MLGDHERARRCLEEAVDPARRTRQPRAEVAALNALARTAMIQGDYAAAKPYLADAFNLASRLGDHEGAAQVLLNLADVSFRLGDAETASTSGQQSLEIAKELKDAQGIAGAHRVLGFATMIRGDLEKSAWHHQQGLEIFRTIGDRWGMATCYFNLGEVHRKMGKVAKAVAFWEKSLPIAREIGARLSVAIAHLNTGGALAQREGSESRAFKNLKIALEEALDIGAMPLILEGLVGVALLYAREGKAASGRQAPGGGHGPPLHVQRRDRGILGPADEAAPEEAGRGNAPLPPGFIPSARGRRSPSEGERESPPSPWRPGRRRCRGSRCGR